MSKIIEAIENEQMGKEVPEFAPGDTVIVQVKVKEGSRERLQVNPALADLLRVLLKAKAEEHGVASKLIATASELDEIAAGSRDVPAMKGWRKGAFGNDALRLCEGKLALKADGSNVVVTLDAGNADFPFILSDYHLPIMPAADGRIDPSRPILAAIASPDFTIETPRHVSPLC